MQNKRAKYLFLLIVATWAPVTVAAEDSEQHLPHHHIGFIVGHAEEEQADGHHESGNVLGVEYIRQFHENWGWGVAFEVESFGDNHKRNGILAIPVSYFPGGAWRLFAAPGIEYREKGDPDKAIFRLGAGYEFELPRHFTLSPEAQVDFIAGGTNVYVIALTIGYGF